MTLDLSGKHTVNLEQSTKNVNWKRMSEFILAFFSTKFQPGRTDAAFLHWSEKGLCLFLNGKTFKSFTRLQTEFNLEKCDFFQASPSAPLHKANKALHLKVQIFSKYLQILIKSYLTRLSLDFIRGYRNLKIIIPWLSN